MIILQLIIEYLLLIFAYKQDTVKLNNTTRYNQKGISRQGAND